jgi:ribosomal protein S18 acetylase RimI-like enzyme
MKTLIRYATSKDFQTLLSIDEACFPPEVAYDSQELRHMMGRSGAETLALEVEGEIGAFLLMDMDRSRGFATLVTLDVLAEYRRQGYASTLLSRSEQILMERGIRRYVLQVDTENEGAIAFYRKKGFEATTLLRNYYPGNRDAWQMVKTLPSSAGT